jgi:hypothetical protein
MLRSFFVETMWVRDTVCSSSPIRGGTGMGSSPERYSQLGEVLAKLALERYEGSSSTIGHGRIEGVIARRIEEEFGGQQDFGREEISDYLHGERWPKPEFIRAFVGAFSLTVVELRLLAWAYTFSEVPHPRIAQHPPPIMPPIVD